MINRAPLFGSVTAEHSVTEKWEKKEKKSRINNQRKMPSLINDYLAWFAHRARIQMNALRIHGLAFFPLKTKARRSLKESKNGVQARGHV